MQNKQKKKKKSKLLRRQNLLQYSKLSKLIFWKWTKNPITKLDHFFLWLKSPLKIVQKNSLKKLTFITLRPTHFESFFSKAWSNPILFTKLSTDSEKSLIFREKAVVCPPVYHTRWKLHTAHFIAKM